MRCYKGSLLAAALVVGLAGGLTAAPALGEQIKYYVWTDENGVIHAEDTPPKDRDYETRVIEVDENVIPAPEPSPGSAGAARSGDDSESGGRSATRSDAGGSSSASDAAIAEEEQRRLGQEGVQTGGAATAPGAKTAPASSGAQGAGAASGAGTAQGAATAPGATFTPPPPPPVGP